MTTNVQARSTPAPSRDSTPSPRDFPGSPLPTPPRRGRNSTIPQFQPRFLPPPPGHTRATPAVPSLSPGWGQTALGVFPRAGDGEQSGTKGNKGEQRDPRDPRRALTHLGPARGRPRPLRCRLGCGDTKTGRGGTGTAIGGLRINPVSGSNAKEVIRAVGRSVTFRTRNTERYVALWSFGNEPIVAVKFEDPPRPLFYKEEFKTRFAVSKKGRALTISQLRMEDAGTYSVTIKGKRSTFTLQVFRELAEPTVTCEAHNCSGGSCSSSLHCSTPSTGLGNVSYTWRVGDQDMDGSSVVLLVNETSQDGLEPLTCTARNPVSNESVTITNLGELCTGARSSSWIRIGVVAGVEIASLLSIFLVSYCKSRGF
ncbi:T-lymphocyte surface antigen Ly-9-like [Ammospiza nelsoni]|uniref:T-lymphocyte surface antigen Ly-9-like n=1 Tax=Ammospiza nelsoni TaxID=2857394 RepID=UPI00286A662A|nr:T-lymphocyte surface antigen Ly-9-like [Ammospiza nelsoni]